MDEVVCRFRPSRSEVCKSFHPPYNSKTHHDNSINTSYADLQYATQKPLLIMDSIKSSLLIVGLLLSHGITMSSGLSTISRRRYLQWQTGGCIATASSTALANPSVAQAVNLKSRTEGYAVQHTEREWAVSRFHMQYT